MHIICPTETKIAFRETHLPQLCFRGAEKGAWCYMLHLRSVNEVLCQLMVLFWSYTSILLEETKSSTEDQSFIFLSALAVRTPEDFKSKSTFPVKNVMEILLIKDEDSPLHTACCTMQGLLTVGQVQKKACSCLSTGKIIVMPMKSNSLITNSSHPRTVNMTLHISYSVCSQESWL